jgi:hypothetical protein
MRNCLVLGGGPSVWNDVDAAKALGSFHGAVACNDAGTDWKGELDALVTLHPNKMHIWRSKREARGYPPAKVYIAHQEGAGVDRIEPYRWPEMNTSGSSGLYAVKIAMELGFDRIVLCGVSLTTDGHYFDSKAWKHRLVESYRAAWLSVMHVHLIGKVKSFSGWTAEQLGTPDARWLAGETA